MAASTAAAAAAVAAVKFGFKKAFLSAPTLPILLFSNRGLSNLVFLSILADVVLVGDTDSLVLFEPNGDDFILSERCRLILLNVFVGDSLVDAAFEYCLIRSLVFTFEFDGIMGEVLLIFPCDLLLIELSECLLDEEDDEEYGEFSLLFNSNGLFLMMRCGFEMFAFDPNL